MPHLLGTAGHNMQPGWRHLGGEGGGKGGGEGRGEGRGGRRGGEERGEGSNKKAYMCGGFLQPQN